MSGLRNASGCVGFWCVCGRETRRAAAPRSKSAWEAARRAARRRARVSVSAFFDEQLSRRKEFAPRRRGARGRRTTAPQGLRGGRAALPERARAARRLKKAISALRFKTPVAPPRELRKPRFRARRVVCGVCELRTNSLG